MSSKFRYTVESGPERADVFLTKMSGKSRAFVQEQIKLGGVLLDDLPLKKMGQKLQVGSTLSGEWKEDPRHLELVAISHPLDLLYEDEHLLVLNKAQGVVVHPAPGHRGETLVHYLLHHLRNHADFLESSPTRPGLVHRLDRGTSGVLLIAKNRTIQEALQKQFRLREVEKEYEAAVWGVSRERGVFNSPIGRDPKDRKRMSSRSQQAKNASTAFIRLSHTAHFSHLALFPKTGRTHQLRVHLLEAKNPVVGDDLYGVGTLKRREHLLAPEVADFLKKVTQTFLHARRLSFTHPVTHERLSFSAERPEIFSRFLTLIAKGDL